MPQDVACPAGEQAKGKLELASSVADACYSLCRIEHATKRYIYNSFFNQIQAISSKSAKYEEDKKLKMRSVLKVHK